MKIRTYFLTKEPIREWAWVNLENGYCEQWFYLNIPHIIRAIKMYKPIKWRIEPFYFWRVFFSFLGTQNDYLYPTDKSDTMSYPYPRPHLWKTRFGFKTSWSLAKMATP